MVIHVHSITNWHSRYPPEEIIQAGLARALDVSGVQRRKDVYACTAALAALRFDRTLVRHLLEERMILGSPLIQEIVQELVEQRVQERLQEELWRRVQERVQAVEKQVQERTAQSRAEGELLAAVHIAERIARQRFGTAPADLAERLRLLEHDRREATIAQLATTPSLDEWLRSLG